MTARELFDPDHQAPMPFQAAEDYAQLVMGWAREELPADVVATRALAYGPGHLHRYDVYAPAGARNAPVLVFWHGGGWTNGYRDYVRFMAPHVTRLGMLLVAPSYRLAPLNPLPAALEDAFALLRALQESIHTLGGAPQALYLSGHSAGGHLATLTTLRRVDRERVGVHTEGIRGCLPISGIMDLYHPAPPAGSLEERVYTMVLRDPEEDAVMSPLCWTVGNTVPMLLTHGALDSERVVRSNGRLRALLQMQPGGVQGFEEAGHNHFQTHTMLRHARNPWYARLHQLTKTGQA